MWRQRARAWKAGLGRLTEGPVERGDLRVALQRKGGHVAAKLIPNAMPAAPTYAPLRLCEGLAY